jgi:hypothetical protein
MYAITRTSSLCFVTKSFNCKAMAIPNVFPISNNPTSTWQGSHLSFKKWTISTNVSHPLKTPKDQNFSCKYYMSQGPEMKQVVALA